MENKKIDTDPDTNMTATELFSQRSKTATVIVTYNPPAGFLKHFEKVFKEFNFIILIDNGTCAEKQDILIELKQQYGKKITMIMNNENLGIATALNQGFRWAIENGYDYIFTLDQDSTPTPGFMDTLLKCEQTHPNRENLATLGSLVTEDVMPTVCRYMRRRNHFLYEHAVADRGLLRNVSNIITSGSLYNLNIWKKLGPFRDDFFIDYVDTEYNLRAIQNGYETSVQCDARLIHNLGNRQEKKLLWKTTYPTFHSPIRWYYICRNRVVMLKLYALKQPYYLLYETVITIKAFIRVFSLENQRRKKFLALVYGTYDGLRNKMNKIPTKIEKMLS
ncbi:dTDP-rhamnosyl transferase RfbF [Chitinispirillum alkaliphilum]|nr:dTDP-rhamnosyl transferase RfbF [Chitinispirillum alkaliphilum]